MKKGLLDKAICLLTSITLLLNSFSPFIIVSLAQEATATPVPTQEPDSSEITPTVTVIPTDIAPTEIAPTETVLIESSSEKGPDDKGAIWTTKIDCGDEDQDINHYAIGEKVFIHGKNFSPESSYIWNITGQNGGASCDPDQVVASGANLTDLDGKFCFEAYIVAFGDCGEYKVDFGGKNDNYHVDGVTPTITETPTPGLQLQKFRLQLKH